MKTLVPLLVLSFLAAAARPAQAAPRKIAVVVGANAAAPGRSPLRFAYNDADRVADVLRLAGFARSDVHVLRDPAPERLLASLDSALGALRATPGETMLVFYYSGHADATSLYPGGAPFSLSRLRERLDRTDVTVRVGIVDACRGGGWTGSKGLSETDPFAVEVPIDLANEGSVLISSSSGLEEAHESETLQGSYFTHHWNAALRGAGDRDGDGTITLGEAFAYAKALTVRDTAREADVPQHPSFRLNLRGRRDLPLVAIGGATNLVTLDQRVGPLQLVHLGTGVTVLEVPPGKRSIRLALAPGRYLVRRSNEQGRYARELDVVAGRAVHLREDDLTLVGEAELVAKGGAAEPYADFRFSVGAGGPSGGTSGERTGTGVAAAISVGYVLRPDLQLVAATDSTTNVFYGPDRGFSQQQSAVTVGMRWTPFEPSGGPLDISVRAGAGVARRSYTDSVFDVADGGEWGGAGTVGLAWMPIKAGGLGFGFELSDTMARFSARTEHSVAFTMGLQMVFCR